MLSHITRARFTLSAKTLWLTFFLAILSGLAAGSVWAQAGTSQVWRGNSREGSYTFKPIRTTPTVAWQYQLPKLSLFAPPVLDGTILYVVSQDEILRALDVNTQAVKWSQSAKGGIHTGMIVDDTTLYYGSDGGLYARDKATGSQKWVFSAQGTMFGSPVAANGIIFFIENTGAVYAVEMASGTEKWHSTSVTGAGINSLAYADGVVYVTVESVAVALDASTGAEKWRVTKTGGVWYDPIVAGGVVYIPHDDGNLYALYLATGGEVWHANIGGMPAGTGAFANGIVYVGTRNNRFHALNASNGTEIWHFDTDDWPNYPSIVSGVLYIGTTNHEEREGERNLYALDAANGTELWRFKADSRLFSPPAFADDVMYLQSWFGKIYALRAAPPAQTTATANPGSNKSPTIAPSVPTVAIPGDASQTFPETGKTVKGLFLDYWQQHGGLAQQGYPISEVLGELSALDGKAYTVQYFERAVFEYHPAEQAPYNVLLSQLEAVMNIHSQEG